MNALTLLTGNRSIRNRRPWLTLLLAWLIVATALSWNPSLVAAQVPLTCVNKTTADGLGNNGVIGVYASGSTIYAATNDGLGISTDGGVTFTNKTTADGLGNNQMNGVYASGSTVYAATIGGLSISTDGGVSFTNKTTADGLGDNSVTGVYASGSTVYAATTGGLSISTDGGVSFTNKTTADGLGGNYVFGIYTSDNIIYAGTNGGLSISTDGGSSFTNKTTADGLGDNSVTGVYASGSTVYAATFGGLSISTDSGASFTNRTTTDGLGNNILFGVYASGSTVYAATNGGLSISTNGGASFTTKTTADGLGADRVNGVYVSGSTVYAATNGGLTICAPLPPEIDLQGSGVSIANGDSTPTSVDGSDLGQLLPGSTTVRTFTIHNSGDVALTLSGSPIVALSGSSAFSVSSQPTTNSVAGDGSTTFAMTFAPTAAGLVTATVSIANDDSDENPYTFVVGGTGVAPDAQLNGVACLLPDAITAANSNAASGACPAGSSVVTDTITLLRDVTLTAINSYYTIYQPVGLPVISSAITLEGAGYTISRADAAPAFRLLTVDFGGTLILNRVTLQNGASVGFPGGAIWNAGRLTVSNSTLSANSAGTSVGGAIYNEGRLTVSSSTFTANHSSEGAAIRNSGVLTISSSTFATNNADYSGGVIQNVGPLTVSNSTFSGNSAGENGGAIQNVNTLMVSNSTFSNNSAGGTGGAINTERGTATVTGSLISGNRAPTGAEVAGTIAGSFNANNTNLFGDSSKTNAQAFFSLPPGATYRTATSDGTHPTALASILSPTLADNGGSTLTHALVLGSPALDAAGDSGLATDQRGISRPQGAADDIGAFELEVAPLPTTITIVLDAVPNLPTNLGFQSSLGPFILDDPALDDGDAYTNTRTFVVTPGSYNVRRNNPAGWFTTAIACSPDGKAVTNVAQRSAAITVAEGDNVTCTFTVERAAVINARAFNDLVRRTTNLGKRNAGDPWLNGQPMTLTTSPTQTLGSGVTAPVGSISGVSFANLRAGSYTVCTSFAEGWTLTTPTAVDPVYGQPCKAVTLAPGQAATVLFGAYEPAIVASELFTPEDETITDADSISDRPYDPAEDEAATDEEAARRFFLPLVNR